MKILIKENQAERLIKIILDYFDNHLVPSDGWDKKKNYKQDVEKDDELFFFFDSNAEGLGDDGDHMWYSVCNNHNLSEPLKDGFCPLVTINSKKYDALMGYFGPRWKELFKRWFTKNTGLPVVSVERQNW